MIIDNFARYINGVDITKISARSLASPSENVFIKKGKISTRLGISLMGQEGEKQSDKRIHSSFTWHASTSGEHPFRAYKRQLQVYKGGLWKDLFQISENAVRVEFASWVDSNTDIIKSRLVFVDGSDNIHTWNGGVAEIVSVSGNNITIKAGKTFSKLGFDKGNVTTQTILIKGVEYTYETEDLTTSTITLVETPTGVVAGDIVIAKPVTHRNSDNLQGTNKDHIFSYNNHLVTANLDSVRLNFSNLSEYSLATGFEFIPPVDPSTRTTSSPFFVNLDGNVTAIAERRGTLLVSTINDWFKIKKSVVVNSYGFNVSAEKSDTAERIGALPFAVANFKGDLIYIAQDKTIQNITDVDNIQESAIKLISDDIEGLFDSYDMEDSMIYYDSQNISVIVPKEGSMVMFDTTEGFWQPPQKIPINRKSIIDGKQIGHSSSGNESFNLFDGGSDLGSEIIYKIVFGKQPLDNKYSEYKYKQFNEIGFNIRMTQNAIANVKLEYETGGGLHEIPLLIDGLTTFFFENEDIFGIGGSPFGTIPLGSASEKVTSRLKRAMVLSKPASISFFEWRPLITLQGKDIMFQLMGISIDASTKDANSKDERLYIK